MVNSELDVDTVLLWLRQAIDESARTDFYHDSDGRMSLYLSIFSTEQASIEKLKD